MRTRSGFRLAGSILVASCLAAALVAGLPPGLQAPGAQAGVPAAGAGPGPSESQLASVTPDGIEGNGAAPESALSSDGRYVVFSSNSTDLIGTAVPSGVYQVYARELATGVTSLISKALDGTPGNADSTLPKISADGGVIAFLSNATNIVGIARTGITQAMYWTKASGSLSLASATADVIPSGANQAVAQVTLADNGSAIAFSTHASNLASTAGGVRSVFRRDLALGKTELVSMGWYRDFDFSGASDPALSGDGRFVAVMAPAFDSAISADSHLYLKDSLHLRDTDIDIDVSLDPRSSLGIGSARNPSLSQDGRFVAFSSPAQNLVPEGSGGHSQIFLRDVRLGRTSMVTHDSFGATPADGDSTRPVISPSGTRVAYLSRASNLLADGRPLDGSRDQAFVTTIGTAHTSLVSAEPGGGLPGNGSSSSPSISDSGTLSAIVSTSTNLTSTATSGRGQVFVHNVIERPRVDRLGGADRYEVSAGISRDTFSPGAAVAYIASGENYPDALSGSAAAGAEHGPVLLVSKSSIPAATGHELQRLHPQEIIVLGGEMSVDAGVFDALGAFAPSVSRISGADRFTVSAAVSASVFAAGATPVAYVASGAVFPDALSGAAAAGRAGGPVLLVQKDGVPEVVGAELARLKSKIIVLGGPNTISDAVVTALKKIGSTTRLAGSDRFELSARVSASRFLDGAHTVYVASGAVFPDALSGSAAAIRSRAPVLLVTADSIPSSVADELDRLDPTRIVVLGGARTVSDAVLDDLKQYLYSAP